MRKSVMNMRIFCVAVGLMTATSAWAQVPVFKMWVTEVYEVNPDGTFTAKCGPANCPTQDLLPGIAQPGDLINIEVTVEGWDASTDSGTCDPAGEVCSVSAQDCAGFHCSGVVTQGQCTQDSSCFPPDTCDPDSCEKSPLMGAFQWTIDSATYSNGCAGPGLAPAQLACTSDADCACAYTAVAGDFNDCADFAAVNPGFCTCTQSGTCDGNVCGPAAVAYIDSSSIPNYVFFSHTSLPAIDLSTLDYEFGASSLDGSVGGVPEELFKCNAGARPICNVDADCPSGTCELVATSPYYLGTLLLEVTGGPCSGLFTLDLVQDTLGNEPIATFLKDNNAATMPTPIVEPLIIGLDVCVQTAGRVPDGGATPGTPLTVGLLPNGDVMLSWGTSCLASDSDFEVYEGMIGNFTSHAPRMCSTGGALTATLTPVPENAYYLIVPRNGVHEGSYGTDSATAERPQSTSACVPQQIGVCP